METPDRESEQAASDSARFEPVAQQSANGASSLQKVRQRLESSKIGENEFLDILRAVQILEAESGDLLKISEKILRLSLDSWDTIEALAAELREQKTEAS